MGVACCLTGKYERSLGYLHKAFSLDPGNLQAMYNIGVANVSLRRTEQAFAAYRTVLEKDPNHTLSLNNIASLFLDIGQPREALAYFRRVIECSPHHATADVSIVRTATLELPINEWPRICNETLLADRPLLDENRYLILIHRATAEWANNNTTAVATSLWAARNVRPLGNERTKNTILYEQFLNDLTGWRNSNPLVYANAPKKIFLVGDSHSLGYANMRVHYNGEDATVSSHLIVGAKAWHIAGHRPNPYMAGLEAHIKRLPEGADLLCTFGEIDCRIDMGILPHWKKTGGSLKNIVTKQVAAYVSALDAHARPKSLRLGFLAVPAPKETSGDRREVVRLFNTVLEKQAQASGHGYIDLYKVSLGKNGYAENTAYIDSFHLKPDALTKALA